MSLYLKIDTKWKHAVIEFFHEHNRNVISLETLILYVAYSIYKYKMYCRLSSFDETNYNIFCDVKSSIVSCSFILKKNLIPIQITSFSKIHKSILDISMYLVSLIVLVPYNYLLTGFIDL